MLNPLENDLLVYVLIDADNAYPIGVYTSPALMHAAQAEFKKKTGEYAIEYSRWVDADSGR